MSSAEYKLVLLGPSPRRAGRAYFEDLLWAREGYNPRTSGDAAITSTMGGVEVSVPNRRDYAWPGAIRETEDSDMAWLASADLVAKWRSRFASGLPKTVRSQLERHLCKADQNVARSIADSAVRSGDSVGMLESIMTHAPIGVPKKLWAKARALDADSLAKANAIAPGCIYRDPAIIAEIDRQTMIASYGLGALPICDSKEDKKKEADKRELAVTTAKEWLLKVCVPRSMMTTSPLLSKNSVVYLSGVYDELRIVRGVLRVLRRSMHSRTALLRRLEELLPNIDTLRGEWRDLLYRGRSLERPQRAAARIYGEALGPHCGESSVLRKYRKHFGKLTGDKARVDKAIRRILGARA